MEPINLSIEVRGIEKVKEAALQLTRESPSLWVVWERRGRIAEAHYCELSLGAAIGRQADLKTLYNVDTEIEMYTAQFPEGSLVRQNPHEC